MDIEDLIKRQNDFEEIFNSGEWIKTINLQQKEEIILSMFHTKNWNQVLPENRICILQQLENIESEKSKRNPYKLVIVGKNVEKQYDLLLMHATREIYIKEHLIIEGKKQKPNKNDNLRRVDINEILNYYLLDSLYHEQSHIKRQINIRNNLNDLINFIKNKASVEEKEYIIWLLTRINMDELQGMKTMLEIAGSYLMYRFVPDEYYAFEDAKIKTMEAYLKMKRIYGDDEAFQKYTDYNNKSEKEIEEMYFKKTNEMLSYNEIYLELMRQTIEEMSKQRNIKEKTIYKEYNLDVKKYKKEKTIEIGD